MEKITKGFKVTYSTLDPAGMEAFHKAYDQALQDITSHFGKSHPDFISGKEVRTGDEFSDSSPINRELLIGKFQKGTAAEFNAAIESAYLAFKSWRDLGYRERCGILRNAAELISERK